MAISFTPIMPGFGATVSGVDLRTLNDAQFEELLDGFHRWQLLLFRDQAIEPGHHVAFAKRFPHDLSPTNYTDFLVPGHPEVHRLGNVVEDGKPVASLVPLGIEWHTDGTSRQLPCIATLLYAVETPSKGGETLFASGYLAFDLLDAETQALLPTLTVRYNTNVLEAEIAEANRGSVHAGQARDDFADVLHPLVRVHPATGRTALWATPREMRAIEGWSRQESLDFVMRLMEPGTAEPHVYAHKWRPGDLIVWDNRCVLHSTTPYTYANERRLMQRVGLNGPSPVPPPVPPPVSPPPSVAG